MTDSTALGMDPIRFRANHHPQMIGFFKNHVFFQPFLLRPAQPSIPNISHSCCFIPSVLHYQRDIIWILFLGAFPSDIWIHHISPTGNQGEVGAFHKSNFGLMIGEITIQFTHATCKELYKVYGIYNLYIVFMALNCPKMLFLMNASHSSWSWLQEKLLPNTKAMQTLSKPERFPTIYFRGVFTWTLSHSWYNRISVVSIFFVGHTNFAG